MRDILPANGSRRSETRDEARYYSQFTIHYSRFLWSLFSWCLVFWAATSASGQEAGSSAVESAMATARERYLDIALMRHVDWAGGDVKGAVERLEFEAARLLSQQVRTGPEQVQGRFRNATIDNLDGLREAFAETSRAMRTLSLAFACRGCRLYQSARVVESMAAADDFLRRAEDLTVPMTPFGTIPPRIQEDPRDAIEWLFQCGSRLPSDTLSSFKKAFSGVRGERRGALRLATEDPPITAFLAALYFKEERLAQRARAEFLALLRSAIRSDGSLLGDRSRLDLLYSANILRDAALYDYLTRGTPLGLDRETIKRLALCLTGFAGRAGYAGEPDAVGLCPTIWSRYADRSQAFAGAVWSGAILLLSGAPLDADAKQGLEGLRARYRACLGSSAFSEGTTALLELNLLDRQMPPAGSGAGAEAKGVLCFPSAGYLVARQADFFASVRLPFCEEAADYTGNDARLLGAMNLLTESFNPNGILLGPRPRWALPGCTACEGLRTKAGILLPAAVKETASLGAAVLENGAVAAAGIVAQGENVLLRANRSWFVFEDKMAALGTGISASTTDIANPGWAAAPGERYPWLVIDLKAPTMINRIRIYYRVKGGVYTCVPHEIIFQVSPDGYDWRDVRSITKTPPSGTPPAGYTVVKFAALRVQYVRLFFPEGADGETLQMSDVQVFYVERPDDEKRLGREVPNLASERRGARAVASSSANAVDTPDKVLTGRGTPGTAPLPARTCVLVTSAKGGAIAANDGEAKGLAIPEKDKETQAAHVRWLNCGGLGCIFLTPANLVIKNERDEECTVFIDHSGSESFGVLYLPNQSAEETARSADAGLVELKLERDVHRIWDKASNLNACAIFSAREKGDVVTTGTGCLVYKVDGARLSCSVTPRLLRQGLSIRVPGIQEVGVNGTAKPAACQGEYVKVNGE